MADPTMEFLASLDDPAKYVKLENVPICRPLTRLTKRRAPDGSESQVCVVITEADLPVIAEQINRMEMETGTLPLATIGHRNQDPSYPETLQPPLVGVFRGGKVGTFGPQNMPCVLSTQYIARGKWDTGFGLNGNEGAKDFPHRSMEIHPEPVGMLRKFSITGVALLKRDPYLQLGCITFELGEGVSLPSVTTFTAQHEKLAQEYLRAFPGCEWELAEAYALGVLPLNGRLASQRAAAAAKPFTREHEKRAQQYLRHHPGCEWEAAEQFALGERTLDG